MHGVARDGWCESRFLQRRISAQLPFGTVLERRRDQHLRERRASALVSHQDIGPSRMAGRTISVKEPLNASY